MGLVCRTYSGGVYYGWFIIIETMALLYFIVAVVDGLVAFFGGLCFQTFTSQARKVAKSSSHMCVCIRW